MKHFLYISLVLILISCGSQAQTELKKKIEAKEKSITQASENLKLGESIHPNEYQELVDLLLAYQDQYEDDPYAPECWDKVHMVYSGQGNYIKSSMFADSILKVYPDYVNRPMILESQALTYDMYIQPRDAEKVKYYYELLLKEDIGEEKKGEIEFRLQNIELTVEELILKQK